VAQGFSPAFFAALKGLRHFSHIEPLYWAARRLRVCAARRAAARRSFGPFVRTAFRAEARLEVAERRRAADFA
jgi:hypothetical protein